MCWCSRVRDPWSVYSVGQLGVRVSTGQDGNALTLFGRVFVSEVGLCVWSWLADELGLFALPDAPEIPSLEIPLDLGLQDTSE